MTDRREFLAGLAGVTVAAGVGINAAAVPAPRPDAGLDPLIAEWLSARAGYYAACDADDDAEEGMAAVREARSAAYDRASDAYDALLAYRPATLPGFAAKVAALLRAPFGPDEYDDDSGGVEALIADAEALVGGAA